LYCSESESQCSGSEERGKLGLCSGLAGSVGEFMESDPLLTLAVLLDEHWLGLQSLADGSLFASNFLVYGGLADGVMSLLVQIFELGHLGGSEGLFPVAELLLEPLLVFLLEGVVVGFNVGAEDVFFMYLIVENLLWLLDLDNLSAFATFSLGFLETEAWEALNVVGHEEATVTSSLEGTEDTVSGGGADKTDIEVAFEWSAVTNVVVYGIKFSINFGVTLVHISHALGGQQSASNQESSAVSSRVVG